MKRISVSYPEGRSALAAYWGFLSDGGLEIEDQGGLAVGDRVELTVGIETLPRVVTVSGRVAQCRSDRGQAVIAFDAGQSVEFLHSVIATAEVDIDGELRGFHSQLEPVAVRVTGASDLGCRIRLGKHAAGAFPVGSQVVLESPDLRGRGCVVWVRGDERGVIFWFDADDPAAAEIREYLGTD